MEQQPWHSGSSCSVHSQVCALSLGIFTFTLVESSAGLQGAEVGTCYEEWCALAWSQHASGNLGPFLIYCLCFLHEVASLTPFRGGSGSTLALLPPASATLKMAGLVGLDQGQPACSPALTVGFTST